MKIKRTFTLAIALSIGLSGAAVAAGSGGVVTDPGAIEGKHFDPKGKMPSKFTIELQNGLRKTLPFEDKRDFEEAKGALSPRHRTSRSWLRPATSRGTWTTTSSCCRARTSTALTPRCSVRPS